MDSKGKDVFNFTGYLPRKKAVPGSLPVTTSTSVSTDEVRIGDSSCFNFTGYHRKRLSKQIPAEITTAQCSGWLLKTTGAIEASDQTVEVDVEAEIKKQNVYDGDVDVEDGDLDFIGFNDVQPVLCSSAEKLSGFAEVSNEDFHKAETFTKASDFALKQYAMNVPVHLFLSFCPCKSARDCTGSHDCMTRICRDGNLEAVFAQQRLIWGPRDSKAPTSKQRGDKLFQLQQKAWNPATHEFVYSFRTSTSDKPTIVCENTYLHMLGFRSDPSGRYRSGQFTENKKRIESNEGISWHSAFCYISIIFARLFLLICFVERNSKQERPDQVSMKSMHCETFLRAFCVDQCDALPGDVEYDVKYCAPYTTKDNVYNEFQAWWFDNGEDPDTIPSFSTFRRVWDTKFKNLGLMACKGNFSTCAICNAGAKHLFCFSYSLNNTNEFCSSYSGRFTEAWQ